MYLLTVHSIKNMANQKYEKHFRDKILRLHLEDGRTIKSLTEEFGLGTGTLKYWLDKYKRENKDSQAHNEKELMIEIECYNERLKHSKIDDEVLTKIVRFFMEENC